MAFYFVCFGVVFFSCNCACLVVTTFHHYNLIIVYSPQLIISITMDKIQNWDPNVMVVLKVAMH